VQNPAEKTVNRQKSKRSDPTHNHTSCRHFRHQESEYTVASHARGRWFETTRAHQESVGRGGIVGLVSRLDRITSDPAVCHGQPTIRGLRYTVEGVLQLLAAGMSVDDVLADYADLERDDILAALEFGARAAGGRTVPLAAA
jgi:uncharacterized protein (DUF433 family)